MKKYDSYKDTEIDFIGKIPDNWDYYNLKFILRDGVKDGPHETPIWYEDGIPFLSIDGIVDGEISFNNCRYIDEEQYQKFSKKLVIEKDDIFIGKAASIGKIARVKTDRKFTVWSPIAVIKVKEEFSPTFVEYYFRSDIIQHQIELFSTSNTQKNIAMGDIPKMKFIAPSFEEQTQIANYLDHKTSKIDDLISKKEQLIELLKEERTAIINQAVTKGLDPNVPMKDSGIEWLGEIPMKWDVKKVKHFTKKIGSGVTPRGGAEVYQKSGIPLLRSQNIYFDYFKLDNVAYITQEVHDSMSNSKVNKGDVLLNITGGSIGRCFFVTDEFEEANVNQHVCILRPNELILTEYLHFLFSSSVGQLQIDLCQQSGNREALNFEQLKNFPFALPSVDEQSEIIKMVNSRKKVIKTSIEKTLQEIELLKEYKTALISEVVTGKVDVREEIIH
jgi:type I restriction enzyme, S subunit